MNLRTCCVFIGLLLLLVVPCKSDIVVFGDSLSDTGNTLIATFGLVPDSDDGYFQGRFTNGNVWIENLATFHGEPLPTPSRAGGSNFAHGGSEVLVSEFLSPSLLEQVSSLAIASPTELHVIWAGSNDLLAVDLDLPVESQNLRAQQVAAGINAAVDELYQKGARRVLVLNVPPLGFTPLSAARLSSEDITDLNNLTVFFNAELGEELMQARVDNPDIDISEFDVHGLFDDAIADPAAFGLTNVTDSATPFDPVSSLFTPAGLATGPPPNGVDPDDYLFYDGLHPTAKVHEILAFEVFAFNYSDIVPPNSIVVSRGTLVAGSLAELDESDDMDFRIRTAALDSQSRTEFEVKGISPVANPTAFGVTLEGALDPGRDALSPATTYGQFIEFFNYDTNEWEVIDSRIPSQRRDGSPVVVDATGDLSRFVEADTFCIEARVRYTSSRSGQSFISDTDQFLWRIIP